LFGEQEHLGRGAFVVELRDESFENFGGGKLARMAREIGPVAPVLTSAEEEHLNAGFSALLECREHIGFGEGGGIDALLQLDMAHRLDAVAKTRGGFKVH